MAKLIRWDTPFTDFQLPSVGLLVETDTDERDILKSVIAPYGIDKYPKYLIDFGNPIAFTCFEEAHAPDRDFSTAEVEELNICAYEYIDSPWLKSYSGWMPIYSVDEKDRFYHYLIFGGDNNIEVITPTRPTIGVVEQSKTLIIKRQI